MRQIELRHISGLIPYARNSNYASDIEGNIYRLCREQKSKSGNTIKKYETVLLNGSIDRYGYTTIRMMIDGKKKHIKAHRIVAETFLDNPMNKLEVNHINGIKSDNRVSNLEWNTRVENNRHAIDTGLLTFQSGDKNKNTKVLSVDFMSIYLMHKFAGYSRKCLAEANMVSRQTIDKIIYRVQATLNQGQFNANV